MSKKESSDENQLVPILEKVFFTGFDSFLFQEFSSYFETGLEHRLYCWAGKYQYTSQTHGMLNMTISHEDPIDETLLSTNFFDILPWLTTMPHLRIYFGQDPQGRPFLSDIEPCGDVYLAKWNHLRELAKG